MHGFGSLLFWNLAMSTGMALMIAALSPFRPLDRHPALRHGLWLLVLVKLITPPVVPLPVLHDVESRLVRQPVSSGATGVAENESLGPVDRRPEKEARAEVAQAFAPAAMKKALWRSISMDVLLLMVSVAVTMIGLFHGWWRYRRVGALVVRSQADDTHLASLAVREAQELGVRAIPSVAIVTARISPFLWCRGRLPIIVFPASLVRQLNDEQLACVIRHELAHWLRGDRFSNAAAFLIVSVFWWNPIAWWARRQMRLAQELSCDAIAVPKVQGGRRRYAETLMQVVDFLPKDEVIVPKFMAGFLAANFVKRRFEMLANKQVVGQLTGAAKAVVALVALLTMCFPVIGQASGVDGDAGITTKLDDSEGQVGARDTFEVRGRVTTDEGQPIVGALVLFPTHFDKETWKRHCLQTRTNESGEFRLEIDRSSIGPSADQWHSTNVWAWAEGRVLGIDSFFKISQGMSMNELPPVKFVTFRLPKPTEKVFRVTNESGQPIPNATVVPSLVRVPNGSDPVDGYFGLYEPLPDDLVALFQRTTNGDGEVTVDSVPAKVLDQVKVVSESHGTQVVSLQNLEPDNVLQMRAVGRLHGHLVGGPIELRRGRLLSITTGQADHVEGVAHVVTDENGSFDLPAISDGALRIFTNLDSKFEWKLLPSGPFSVKAGQDNEVSLKLEKGILAKGRLVVQGVGKPVHGAKVAIHSGSFTNHDQVLTDELGEFQTFAVPGREVVFQVIGLDGNPELTFPQTVQFRFNVPEDGDEFRVPDMEIPQARTWRGKLIDQTGQPISGRYVQALKNRKTLDHPARTDESGAFLLRLRVDQVPDEWSVLMAWRQGNDREDQTVSPEIVSQDPLTLRIP